MKRVLAAVFLVFCNSAAFAKTTYPSISHLPFPWESPEGVIDLDALSFALPAGSYTLDSKIQEETTTNNCFLTIVDNTDENKIEFQFSGQGFHINFDDGSRSEKQVRSVYVIPKTHFVAPMRERPYVRFGFPEAFVTTGLLEEKGEEYSLRFRKWNGFILSKLYNEPYTVSPMSSSLKDPAFSLRFDDSLENIIGISASTMDETGYSIIHCRIESGIQLNRKINLNRCFLKDLP